MPVFALAEEHVFPDPTLADSSGLLAIGGDLHPRRLLLAYSCGIFPWYSEGQPILWHSPDPRFVLLPDDLHIGRSLRQRIKQQPFRLSLDEAFDQVIRACADVVRPEQEGTWVTDSMIEAYEELHAKGFAHSVEAWVDDRLVGGLYGVSLGSVFFGESMFARTNDSSKVAFVALGQQLVRWGFSLIDSQVHTDHLERFGAREIPREDYLTLLVAGLDESTRVGPWSFDNDPYEAMLALAEEERSDRKSPPQSAPAPDCP